MLISESDVRELERVVICTAWKVVGLEDPEWKDIDKVSQAIKESNKELFDLIAKFKNAYREWYQFHVDYEKKNLVIMPPEDIDKLFSLIKERDNTRSNFIDRIDIERARVER